MPWVRKSEYDRMKEDVDRLRVIDNNTTADLNSALCRLELSERRCNALVKDLDDAKREAEKWRRHYKGLVEVYCIDEIFYIPGCFKPMDSLQYILKRDEEKYGSDRHAC